jgi:release factor glutamine methyltransferase
VDPAVASLASPLLRRLRRSVDVLIFNPPYVPTEAEEAENAQAICGIAGSWAGGLFGMALTNTLLDQVDVSSNSPGHAPR